MNLLYWTAGIVTLLTAIIFYYPTFFYVFLFVLYSATLVILSIAATIYVHCLLSSKSQPQASHLPSNVLYNATRSSIFDSPKPIRNASSLPVIFGRTVDGLLQQIIEYTIRDFISPWLGHVVRKPKTLMDVVREDLWNAIQKLRERAVKVDGPKMFAVDIVVRVTVHLEKIRIYQARQSDGGSAPTFATASYLESEEKELEFLRKISEIMVIFLLPRGYSLSPLKNLISEILSYKIFHPLIKMLTSPDYINQKIVQYMESRLAAAAISKRSYEYAASFEDFLKIINNSQSVDELLMMRSSIVNDIMQATTMQNLRRAKGLDPDGEEGNLSKTSQKLKRYIQQLTLARAQTERNLNKLGWDGNFNTTDLNLSMLDILSTVVGRRYLTLFLEPLHVSSLVGFYTSVEELKHSPKTSEHQVGAEIFYTYIRAPSSEIVIDKSVRKKMEAFLLGDIGSEVFYEAQKTVLQTLEDKYYPPFLQSQQYLDLRNTLTSEDIKDISLSNYADSTDESSSVNSEGSDMSLDLTNHSTYARNKLDQLQERLNNKNQALQALKCSLKPESKILSILEKEVDWLKGEKHQLEAHLMRTEIWADNLGKWKATVQSVDVNEEKDSLQFMILVQTDESVGQECGENSEENGDNVSTGWVVLRSLNNFQELNRKLRPLCREIRSLELPSMTFKLFFQKNDKSSLEKAKGQIQKYLNFILTDDHLNQSEALYAFLSPSSDHLKQVTPSPKKSKFSLATLFKGNAVETSKHDAFWGCPRDSGEDEMSSYLEGANSTDAEVHKGDGEGGKDSIAEPLYALLGEIFDMGGVFKWVRKSLISFVQITYGRTINRQIRDTVNYLFEETMLHHYASTALKSFWPGGVLASAYPERTDDMREMTANAAKSLLIDNIPEVLCNLVGAQTAKHGTIKIFETIQDVTHNKQLFYEMLEILMLELFPEIRQLKPNYKQHSNNSHPHKIQ
ncbi:sorting nexin-25 [Phlebotomus argentipes]|uniref:sorting nexin-25 n=1 Tax=Phlebotomus argentipes TaxID=94469 RepID=UPI00289352F0|nr:sorting nexin-25 [Phlebotomus argentipes]